MLEQCEGSHAVARAVALSRPEVICAYPISPQTHIVEGLGEMVKSGDLTPCEFINVESEFAALSVPSVRLPPVPGLTPPRPARGCCTWQKPFTTPRAWACRL